MMTAHKAPSVDLDALWNDCLRSLAPTDGSLSATATAWADATEYLQPAKLEETNTLSDPPDVIVKAITKLHEYGLIQDLVDWHRDQCMRTLRGIFAFESAANAEDLSTLLVRLASYLQQWMKPQQSLMEGLPSTSIASPLIAFRKTFLNHLLPLLLSEDFIARLRVFFGNCLEAGSLLEEGPAELLQAVQAIHYLGLFPRTEPVLLGLAYSQIEQHIQAVCEGDFETPDQLDTVGEWFSAQIGDRLVSLYSLAFHHLPGDEAYARAIKTLKPAMQRFEWHIYMTMTKIRLSQLFDVIVEYPDSVNALKDLSTCLSKTDTKSLLVRTLTRQIKKRLLHPGANTRDIVAQYINLIRAMRILDPPGILLAKIAPPMRAYLRARKDTIRCIVQGMVDEDGDLMEELRGNSTSENEEVQQIKEKAEDEVENFADDGYNWAPAPIDAPVEYLRNKTADIIQLLVSIYDTKELFVKELQLLLAERLLHIREYAFEREIRNVEILKMRFGASALAGLEVMLKDCADSKRTDNGLHALKSTSITSTPVHALVVSHLFWPRFKKDKFKLPGQLAKHVKQYELGFTKLKPEKRLQWLPTLGSVSLEISLSDRTLDLEVTPLQAAVLELFNENCSSASRSVLEVRTILRVRDIKQVTDSLQFWHQHEVIAPQNPTDTPFQLDTTWVALERAPSKAVAPQLPHAHTEAERALASTSTSAPQAMDAYNHSAVDPEEAFEAIQPYWGFIQNALVNLHSLPSTRLQSMMLSLAPGYAGHSVEILEAFLEIARSEGLLVKNKDGFWRLAAV